MDKRLCSKGFRWLFNDGRISSFNFGIVIANALRAKGIEDDKGLAKYMSIAGIGAGLLLSIIYVILGYVGSMSGSLGTFDNGAQVLAQVMTTLFGQGGVVLLGLILRSHVYVFQSDLLHRVVNFRKCISESSIQSVGIYVKFC